MSECLRDGLITPRDVRTIVERTDLVIDPDHQKSVDGDIADTVRRGGSWSANRMRDMIDRVVFRVDSTAVRFREKALDDNTSEAADTYGITTPEPGPEPYPDDGSEPPF